MQCVRETSFRVEDGSPVNAPTVSREYQQNSRALQSREDENLQLERPQQLELVRLRTPRGQAVKSYITLEVLKNLILIGM